jgi:hypothetical protein
VKEENQLSRMITSLHWNSANGIYAVCAVIVLMWVPTDQNFRALYMYAIILALILLFFMNMEHTRIKDKKQEFFWSINVQMPTANGVNISQLQEMNTAIRQMNEDTLLVYQITQGICKCAEDVEKDLAIKLSANHKKFELPSPHPTLGCVIQVKDYEPSLFHQIRVAHRVSVKEYISSWNFHPANVPVMDIGAGRSGSLFLLSSDKRFLYKTIPKHEVETLLTILPDYVAHVCSNPSRLMKFVGLHRFRANSTTLYLLVAVNLFYNALGCEIQTKYDLKGRERKKDFDKISKEPNRGIYKDNQLCRSFYPTESARQELVEVIQNDVAFLQKHDCIDYSLLIGVHNTKTCPAKHYFHSATASHKHAGHAPDAPADQDEIYTVGIIDFLSRWTTWKKQAAHFFKSFLWEDKTLSTVSQDYYAKRFNNYLTSTVFPAQKQPHVVNTATPASPNSK